METTIVMHRAAILIPAFLIFAVWIALGAEVALRAAARLHSYAPAAALAALAALLAWRAATAAPQVDASADRRAIDFAERALAAAPRGAIVVTESDLDTFPLWYKHYALSAPRPVHPRRPRPRLGRHRRRRQPRPRPTLPHRARAAARLEL